MVKNYGLFTVMDNSSMTRDNSIMTKTESDVRLKDLRPYSSSNVS